MVRPNDGDPRRWPVDPTAYGPIVPTEWTPADILRRFSVIPFKDSHRAGVTGFALRQFALRHGCQHGQSLAERLHGVPIPFEWRWNHPSRYWVFPGTVWRNGSGYLQVPYLCSHEGCFYLLFECLGMRWYNDGCLFRLLPSPRRRRRPRRRKHVATT